MEADQAPQVGEDLRPRHKTACQVAQINPRRRRVLPQPKQGASSLARPDPLVRMIPSSVRSNVRQRVLTMRCRASAFRTMERLTHHRSLRQDTVTAND